MKIVDREAFLNMEAPVLYCKYYSEHGLIEDVCCKVEKISCLMPDDSAMLDWAYRDIKSCLTSDKKEDLLGFLDCLHQDYGVKFMVYEREDIERFIKLLQRMIE